MPKFKVTITYLPLHPPSEKTSDVSSFDPPANPTNPFDRNRQYVSVVSARSEHDAYLKVLASRREVEEDRRIYENSVVSHYAQRLP